MSSITFKTDRVPRLPHVLLCGPAFVMIATDLAAVEPVCAKAVCHWRRSALSVAIKLAVMPIIAFILVKFVFSMPPGERGISRRADRRHGPCPPWPSRPNLLDLDGLIVSSTCNDGFWTR